MKKRKQIRIREYDYSKAGYYFITICTKNRENILSIINKCRGEHCSSVLTTIGRIVDEYINNIEKVYKNVKIDEYIIMPNHIHIILIIARENGNSVSKIIQQLKGKITKKISKNIWQKLFYEHIIRNEKEYLEIKEYIINNPIIWDMDKYY